MGNGLDEDYIKSIEEAELTLAQYLEIISQLTCSCVPDWTEKQVTLWAGGECIGDHGNKYITHGSDSIEELLVPFVRIGETQNG